MKTIFTLLLLGIIGQSYAQTGRFYKGTINYTTKITLYLKGLDYGINADPIVGVYKYDNQKGYILLSGYRNNNGHLSLVELASANFTGTFLGTFNHRKVVGKWISANQNRNYAFELELIRPSRQQLEEFENAILQKASAIRGY